MEGWAVDESVAAGVEVLPRDSVAADVAVEHWVPYSDSDTVGLVESVGTSTEGELETVALPLIEEDTESVAPKAEGEESSPGLCVPPCCVKEPTGWVEVGLE